MAQSREVSAATRAGPACRRVIENGVDWLGGHRGVTSAMQRVIHADDGGSAPTGKLVRINLGKGMEGMRNSRFPGSHEVEGPKPRDLESCCTRMRLLQMSHFQA